MKYLWVLFMTGMLFANEVKLHSGICDASAGILVGDHQVLIANDEDQFLRLYDMNASTNPVQAVDLSQFITAVGKNAETDLEGATQLGARSYWIGSHGNNKNGKQRPSRHILFALNQSQQGGKTSWSLVGKPYRTLLKDLVNYEPMAPFHLQEASELAPKEEGGFNIEGLSMSPTGSLLIGFRSPVPLGKALIVPIENPSEVMQGASPKFALPIQLDLGGNGIRSIEYSTADKGYWIVSGPVGSKGAFRMYFWSGNSKESPRALKVALGDLNPEGLLEYSKQSLLLLSDDGAACKDKSKRDLQFRSMVVQKK